MEPTAEEIKKYEEDRKERSEKHTGHLEEEISDAPRGLIKHLISQLHIGMDLSKVTLPTFVLETRSLLEKLTDFLSHSYMLLRVGSFDDPIERMIAMARWFLSGWHVKPKGVKKPYNPILGEVFWCHYMVEGMRLSYFSEQVSHHPPISAFYGECKEKNIVINGHYYPKSRFLGNSVASLGGGECYIQLLDRNETYRLTWPNVYARGIIFGRLVMELGGKTTIECEETGLHTEIDFKTKGMFFGEYDKIEAKIKDEKNTLYRIFGKWSCFLEMEKKGDSRTSVIPDLFFDPMDETIDEKIVPSLEELPDNNSRKVWNDVTIALHADDIDSATDAKTVVEEEQRRLRKVRAEEGVEWEPKFFKRVEKGDKKQTVWECIRSKIDSFISEDHPDMSKLSIEDET